MRCSLWVVVAMALWPGLDAPAPAQSVQPKDLAAGKILVASRSLPDPNFARTVILLVHYNEEGTVGLIINRRTKVPLSRIFQEVATAKDRSDPVYAGGPVGRTGVQALMRSRTRPEDAEYVFADVHLISSKDLLEKTVASGAESSVFRVYLGYAGWSVGQLEKETELGAWYIFRGDAGLVFDADPDALWNRLIRQTELQIARVRASTHGRSGL